MGSLYALMMHPFERKLKATGNVLGLNDDIETMASVLSEWATDGSPAMQKTSIFKNENDGIPDYPQQTAI